MGALGGGGALVGLALEELVGGRGLVPGRVVEDAVYLRGRGGDMGPDEGEFVGPDGR